MEGTKRQLGFDKALEIFVTEAQGVVNAGSSGKDPVDVTEPGNKLGIEHGRRYVRITQGQCGTYCYVDLNGDILKNAGRKPHPKPRGNIFEYRLITEVCDWFGAHYDVRRKATLTRNDTALTAAGLGTDQIGASETTKAVQADWLETQGLAAPRGYRRKGI